MPNCFKPKILAVDDKVSVWTLNIGTIWAESSWYYGGAIWPPRHGLILNLDI
jgi:hypothetical protein